MRKNYLLTLLATSSLLLFLTLNASAKVLISKIQTSGVSTTDEFVELYNFSDTTTSLSGWSLKKLTASGSASNLVSSFASNILIDPFSYLLITHRDYQPINGAAADVAYSNASVSLADNNSLVLNDTSGATVDRVDWGSTTPPVGSPAPNPAIHQSLTRSPNDDTGNGTDSDNSSADFILLDSNPFNSFSYARPLPIPEPTTTLDIETTSTTASSTPTETTTTPDSITDTSTTTSSTETITDITTTTSPNTITTTTDEVAPISTDTIWSQIKINEFLPDPDAGNEWIELYNPTTSSLNLTGGTLCDNRTSSSCVIATPTSTIAARSWLLITLTSNHLNNDGDSVILKNPAGLVVDSVVYGSGSLLPKTGQALARTTDGADTDNDSADWAVTTAPTPGSINTIIVPVTPAAVTHASGNGNTIISPSLSNPTTTNSTTLGLSSFSPSSSLIINELYPNPPGSDLTDEFIELKNISNTVINLTGWKIADSAKSFVLSGSLNPNALLVLPRPTTGISLNNSSAEKVTLTAPNGVVIDTVVYKKAEEGQSYSRADDGKWYWSDEVTKGAPNLIDIADSSIDAADQKEISITVSASSSTITTSTPDVAINEIFPNPTGVDTGEFVELLNNGDTIADLSGWYLTNQAGKTFTLPNNTLIPGNGLLAFYRTATHLILSNSGDSVKLLSPTHEVIDLVKYKKSIDGKSYQHTTNGWYWGTPTPGAATILENNDESPVKSTKTSGGGAANNLGRITLTDARDAIKGDSAVVEGTVVALPNTLGKDYFYIEDDTGGLQIYSGKKDFPDLKLGEVVEVRGKISVANNIKRLNIKNKNDITIVKTTGLINLTTSTVESIGEDSLGKLVTVQGEITQLKTNYLYVDDGTAEMIAYFKPGAHINRKSLNVGDNVIVSGVLEQTKTGWQLLPRDSKDIVALGTSPEAVAEKQSAEAEQSKKLKEEYAAATAGGFTTIILAWLARARGLMLVGGLKRITQVATGLLKKKEIG